jgi:hypothetical protein
MQVTGYMIQEAKVNPKSEARNPKQYQSSNIKCSKPWLTIIAFFLKFWSFGFIWDLEFSA